jgi:phospho-N-acetylmuramoyl-pentapeptide-transferase
MGGSLILLALIGSTLLWADPRNTMVWLVAAITALYGGIGYVDDAAKIRKQHSGGLSGRVRLLLEFGIALAVCAYLWYGKNGLPDDWQGLRDRLSVPFIAFNKHPIWLPSVVSVAFAAWVIVGTANAVNLTDGLDGLAIGPVIINAGAYLILCYLAGATLFGNDLASYLDIPSIASAGELSIYCGALIGAGVGFLWYNTYPAQVFMGDVGSLALGGGLGALAVVTKNELLSAIQGGVFVVETVSVIGQVFAFKVFKRRILLMAPIHHHFEKQGWAEPKIIVRFWIISIMLALLSLSTLKLR